MRFDEVELETVSLGIEETPRGVSDSSMQSAPRGRRLMALCTDLSLFAALTLALLPLLPRQQSWVHLSALAGFVLVVSFHYYVGSWMLWGKTIGGTIFDVRITKDGSGVMSLRDASLRWLGLLLSLLTGGLGFALAALPSRRSLPDRLSGTMAQG